MEKLAAFEKQTQKAIFEALNLLEQDPYTRFSNFLKFFKKRLEKEFGISIKMIDNNSIVSWSEGDFDRDTLRLSLNYKIVDFDLHESFSDTIIKLASQFGGDYNNHWVNTAYPYNGCFISFNFKIKEKGEM